MRYTMIRAVMARMLAVLTAAALLSPLAICRCTHAGPCAGAEKACAQETTAPRDHAKDKRSCCHPESPNPDAGQKAPAPRGGCGCAKVSASTTPLILEPTQSHFPPQYDTALLIDSLDFFRPVLTQGFFIRSVFDTGPPYGKPLFVLNCSFLI